MRNLLKRLFGSDHRLNLKECIELQIDDNSAGNLYGGFKEAKLSIHEQQETKFEIGGIKEIFTDINSKPKTEI